MGVDDHCETRIDRKISSIIDNQVEILVVLLWGVVSTGWAQGISVEQHRFIGAVRGLKLLSDWYPIIQNYSGWWSIIISGSALIRRYDP